MQGGAWLTLPARDIDLLRCDRPRDDGRCYALNHLRRAYLGLCGKRTWTLSWPFLWFESQRSPRSRTDIGVLVNVPGPNDAIERLL